jgi:ribonuclease P protein component
VLARSDRLRDRKDVSRVYSKGISVRSHPLTLKFLKNSIDHNRTAVVVSKKVAKSAPLRNRIRRRIFSLVREKQLQNENHYDAIISVFDGDVAKMDFSQLSKIMDELYKRANL